MKIGIVGLPNVGKSTMFNSITNAGAECANYPFCTIEPNVGVVPVPDERLDVLGKMYNTQKITHAIVEFVDIAGLVKGASKGEGLGNKFLSHIREVDAIAQVVRCFEDPNIVHVDGSINPIRDIETINLELILADIETVEKRLEKAKKNLKADKKYQEEIDCLEKIKKHLEAEKPARTLELNDDEKEILKDMMLLTAKPILYICNVSEEQLANAENDENVKKVKEYVKNENSIAIPLCAKIEEELTSLEEADKKEMLEALGLKESGLDRVIRESYSVLGLMSFLTAGEPEVRAWTIKKGTKQSIKTAKNTTTLAKKGIKTSEQVAKNTKIVAKESVKMTQRAVQISKKTIQATIKATKVTVQATIKTVKAIITTTKAIISAIIAGGWVAVVIILVIALIGGFIAAIFNSNGDADYDTSQIPNSEIILVAKAQIGNEGGDKFWKWYGFEEHVHWCACYVSWCANECDYIEKGIIPKFSVCTDGINWFKEKNEWHDRGENYYPIIGDIIFFDWKDENGNQDGTSDHVGIVTRTDITNRNIYTIEGNTSNKCAERMYSFDDVQVMGYGSPKYE